MRSQQLFFSDAPWFLRLSFQAILHLAGASEVLHWLHSICWDLSSAGSQDAQLSEVSMFTLCALLEHSEASVKMAAAKTVAAAAQAVPVCGVSFLPVLVHHLQQMTAEAPQSGAPHYLHCLTAVWFWKNSHPDTYMYLRYAFYSAYAKA